MGTDTFRPDVRGRFGCARRSAGMPGRQNVPLHGDRGATERMSSLGVTELVAAAHIEDWLRGFAEAQSGRGVVSVPPRTGDEMNQAQFRYKSAALWPLLFLGFGIGCSGTSGGSSTGGQAGASGVAGGTTTEATTTQRVGAACSDDSQCPSGGSGTPSCLTQWPEGYCAIKDCAVHGHDCPEDPGQAATNPTDGAKCVLSPLATCLALCASDSDCRAGYQCSNRDDAAGHGKATVCVPRDATTTSATGGQGGMGNSSMSEGQGMNGSAGAEAMMAGTGGTG